MCLVPRFKLTARLNMYLQNALLAPSEDNNHEFGTVKTQKKTLW